MATADDGHPDAARFLVADSTESELLDDRRDALLFLGLGGLSLLVGVGVLVASLAP